MSGKIYTRTGDKGSTRVYGGKEVDKDDIRIECLGTIDEANSTLGLLRSKLEIDHPWQPQLKKIQKDFMDMMSHIATPSDSPKENKLPMPTDGAAWAEEWMDAIEASLKEASEYFLLPGGNEISSLCHVIRTQIRRGERTLISLHKIDPVHPAILKYINRLSDLFFKLAREEMEKQDISEEKWHLFVYKRIRPQQ